MIQNCDIGVDIQSISAIGIEKEVLLPPCVRFRVEDFVDMGNGLIEFQLNYSTSPRELIELVPPPHFLKE